jgi:NADPH-dependent glutamate synthase beta subunit-like oxidoreductase
VFEAWHDVGGVLRYGIPEFRLPKATVDKEIDVCDNWALSLSAMSSSENY